MCPLATSGSNRLPDEAVFFLAARAIGVQRWIRREDGRAPPAAQRVLGGSQQANPAGEGASQAAVPFPSDVAAGTREQVGQLPEEASAGGRPTDPSEALPQGVLEDRQAPQLSQHAGR